MLVQYLDPDGMIENTPYHHVAVGTGTRFVHVAGQVAHMPAGEPVPTDLASQVSQALRNVHRGLVAAGAQFSDVVRLTVYVTEWETSQMGEFMAGVEAVAPEIGLQLPMPPASLIAVVQLFEPGVLVEIEATALL
ncbi:enamine deaminase RidA (YjgF/YER057c/UK114 family) [Leucobacter exalbidus]|uniref:Enamine deaminase RidA (YjgF/YER057c/UK114 family) n=1 Tax=Leucobacter exalbidus TaxID=662960 RepID=A0A940PJ53_9MICO|nr:RidA family protein [Leucobacter exalbidus]MBP1324832.1 enamine deaminase RidA (YjgF/YER057c/UK114 family) [Leucobacter exalbidus]